MSAVTGRVLDDPVDVHGIVFTARRGVDRNGCVRLKHTAMDACDHGHPLSMLDVVPLDIFYPGGTLMVTWRANLFQEEQAYGGIATALNEHVLAQYPTLTMISSSEEMSPQAEDFYEQFMNTHPDARWTVHDIDTFSIDVTMQPSAVQLDSMIAANPLVEQIMESTKPVVTGCTTLASTRRSPQWYEPQW